jgi:hypothetical protein
MVHNTRKIVTKNRQCTVRISGIFWVFLVLKRITDPDAPDVWITSPRIRIRIRTCWFLDTLISVHCTMYIRTFIVAYIL